MSTTLTPVDMSTGTTPPAGPPQADVPRRPRRLPNGVLSEFAGPAIAAAVVAWLPFKLAGISAPFGQIICWFFAFLFIYWALVHHLHGALAAKDRVATVVIYAGGVVTLTPLVLIVWYVLSKGARVVFTHFPHFLVTDLRHAGPDQPFTKAGMKHAIIGTIEQVGIATLITTPIGVFTAVYLNEVRGRIAGMVRSVVDAMTGIPTIIAGLFIYLIWVQPHHADGHSGFAGSMAISVLMIPYITRASEEVLKIVPGTLREASLALGSSEWRTIVRVVLPTARVGLVTAMILGVARGVGETAPVLFTAFGSNITNWNPFHGPQADLPLAIFSYITTANQNFIDEAHGAALVLVLMVLTLFTLARLLGSGGASSPSIFQKLRRR